MLVCPGGPNVVFSPLLHRKTEPAHITCTYSKSMTVHGTLWTGTAVLVSPDPVHPSVRKHKHCPPRRIAGPQNNVPTKRYVHIIIFFSKSEIKMDKKPKGRATVKMIDFRELEVDSYNIRCGYRCVSSARGGDAIRCVCKHSYRAHTMRWFPVTRSAVYFSNERYWPV